MTLKERILTPRGFLYLSLLLVVLLRLPSLFEPYWYLDENMYLAIGQGLRRGLLLYSQLFDNKPPALYYLASLMPSLFALRFVLLVSQLINTWLFVHLSEVVTENRTIRYLSILIFVLLTSTPLIEGTITNAEILMMPFTLGSLLLLLRSSRKDQDTPYAVISAAGFLMGLSLLFKIHAVFDYLAVIFFFLILTDWKLRNWLQFVSRTFIFSLGFLSPILLTSFLFWTQGNLGPFLFANFFYNFEYAQVFHPPLILTGLSLTLPLRLLLLLLGLAMISVMSRKIDRTEAFLYAWFLIGLFAVTLSSRNYPHYLLQLVPALSIILSWQLLGSLWQRLRATSLLLILVGLIQVYSFYRYLVVPYYENFTLYATGQRTSDKYDNYFDNRMWRINELSEYVADNTQPDDRIFIVGELPQIYAQSDRLPSGRFLTIFQMEEQVIPENLSAYFETDPPKIIIDIDRGAFHVQDLNAALDSYLANHYEKRERVADVVVYERRK